MPREVTTLVPAINIGAIADADNQDSAHDAIADAVDVLRTSLNRALLALARVRTSSSGAGITELTGDGTAIGPGSAVLTLAAAGVVAGTYGDATNVGQFTVDAKGRVTAAADVPITFPPPGLSSSWIPLSLGVEPLQFVSNGAGQAVLVAYP